MTPTIDLVWAAADRAANNVTNISAFLAPSNLRQDLRQGELSKDHCLDRSDKSKWPNL